MGQLLASCKIPLDTHEVVSYSAAPMLNGMLTVNEVADRLGVTSSRVRQLIMTGELPAQKLGVLNVIAAKDLARYQQLKHRKFPKRAA